jgi:elongation factor 1 alpha-like protein
MGRLLYDLKAVDERTMQKYRQESQKAGKGSFALAWVMDQSEEERKRFVVHESPRINDLEVSQ